MRLMVVVTMCRHAEDEKVEPEERDGFHFEC